MINPQTQPLVHTTETTATEADTLALQGFSEEEITSLLWLHQWYQHGGSDRIEVLRHLEFIKQLFLQGTIEL